MFGGLKEKVRFSSKSVFRTWESCLQNSSQFVTGLVVLFFKEIISTYVRGLGKINYSHQSGYKVGT